MDLDGGEVAERLLRVAEQDLDGAVLEVDLVDHVGEGVAGFFGLVQHFGYLGPGVAAVQHRFEDFYDGVDVLDVLLD